MPPASIAPCPAAQFIVSASRCASERIDPIPPTPHGVADDADHPADERHKERPVPCDTNARVTPMTMAHLSILRHASVSISKTAKVACPTTASPSKTASSILTSTAILLLRF